MMPALPPTRDGRSQLPPPAMQPMQPMLPAPRQMSVPASPRSQLGGMRPQSVPQGYSQVPNGYSQVPEQWQQMGGSSGALGPGRAPRAPQSPFGAARRPDQSQVFDGGPSYPGPYSDPRAGGNGYERDARRPGSPSRIEWDDQ
jgi:hypothetical protein